MSNFEPRRSFEHCGYVVRKWVSDKGTFASVVLDIPGERGAAKIDYRCFADGPLDQIRNLQGGQKVVVSGSIDMECLRGKDKKDVKVDGYNKWIPCLTIRTMEVETSSAMPSADDNLGW